jgi:hypothetical protein
MSKSNLETDKNDAEQSLKERSIQLSQMPAQIRRLFQAPEGSNIITIKGVVPDPQLLAFFEKNIANPYFRSHGLSNPESTKHEED